MDISVITQGVNTYVLVPSLLRKYLLEKSTLSLESRYV